MVMCTSFVLQVIFIVQKRNVLNSTANLSTTNKESAHTIETVVADV